MKALLHGILPVFVLSAALSAEDLVKEGDRWWSHIQVLASDAMQGRNTGSAGHAAAAGYVAAQFERAGLKPAGTEVYIQPVKFKTAQIIETESNLAIVRNGEAIPLQLGPDATLGVRAGLAESIEAEAVFVGYALQIPEYKFDDFAGQDLRGKIVVYIAGGPSDIPGNLRSHYSFRAQRWKALQQLGAVGAVAIPNPRSMDIPWERANLSRLNATMDIADERYSDAYGQKFAATFNPAKAEMLFTGSGHTFAELLALADQGKALPRFPLTLRFRATEKMELAEVTSQNVIGMLVGSDPVLKDEYVVFGAHLDHLGTGAPINGDSIYNGAMDDGSGIASLIGIATLFKEEKRRPKRSIIFAAVTGEEKGMLGSTFFTRSPTVPIKSIVAEVNMDMYLPLYPLKFLEIIGLEESTLGDDVRAVAKTAGIGIQAEKEPNRNLLIRSDQYSFIQQGIPVVFGKFGWQAGSPEEKMAKAWIKERYHAPSDDLQQPVDKVAAAKFNRFMYDLGTRIANASTRPQWNEKSFFKRFEKK